MNQNCRTALAYLYVYGKGSVDADDSEAKYPYFFRTVASNEHDKYLNVFSYYSMCQFAKSGVQLVFGFQSQHLSIYILLSLLLCNTFIGTILPLSHYTEGARFAPLILII